MNITFDLHIMEMSEFFIGEKKRLEDIAQAKTLE